METIDRFNCSVQVVGGWGLHSDFRLQTSAFRRKGSGFGVPGRPGDPVLWLLSPTPSLNPKP